MASSAVSIGSHAFVGPRHAAALNRFTYVKVIQLHDGVATVLVTGPEGEEPNQTFKIPTSVVQLRLVEDTELELWPGTLVGEPIAFVQPGSPAAGEWDYGVVRNYTMQSSKAVLLVTTTDGAVQVELDTPDAVVKADWLTYALKTGATISAVALNAAELVQLQKEVLGLCRKPRRKITSPAIQQKLTSPYVPEDRIPLIKPDTLAMVYVRRQHVVDCETGPRAKRPRSVFMDPVEDTSQDLRPLRRARQSERRDALAAEPGPSARRTRHNKTTSYADDSPEDDEIPVPRNRRVRGDDVPTKALGSNDSSIDDHDSLDDEIDDDLSSVRLQNASLRDTVPRASVRLPTDESRPSIGMEAIDHEDAILTSLGNTVPDGSLFRPSLMERRVHNAIAHPRLAGKIDAQSILEWVQPSTQFLALPGVLRGLYDFGFGQRGLSIMHLRRTLPRDQSLPGLNYDMTDFARRNGIPEAQNPRDIRDVVSALLNLITFADRFYNAQTRGVIRDMFQFINEYSDIREPDQNTCIMLVMWIKIKFGRFRSLVLTAGITAACAVSLEFTRNDNFLLALRESQWTSTAPVARVDSTYAPQELRASRPSNVPTAILAQLPKRNKQSLCMRYLSQAGCPMGTGDKCLSRKRAHFKPDRLPNDVRNFIVANYQGLAPQFADL